MCPRQQVPERASYRRIFWRIRVPLMRPALGAAFLFQFTAVWNDFLLGITLSRTAGVAE
ncbi:hypothetical protein [Streptomyces sp. NPDC017529]|uniref:hypothetical protein n=1 Tax=Streptomyces sp. NPDC017529 TaxID=3365000 RepID=UPI0037905CFE